MAGLPGGQLGSRSQWAGRPGWAAFHCRLPLAPHVLLPVIPRAAAPLPPAWLPVSRSPGLCGSAADWLLPVASSLCGGSSLGEGWWGMSPWSCGVSRAFCFVCLGDVKTVAPRLSFMLLWATGPRLRTFFKELSCDDTVLLLVLDPVAVPVSIIDSIVRPLKVPPHRLCMAESQDRRGC